MGADDTVEIEGHAYQVIKGTTLSRRAVARLRGNDIIITLPIFVRGRRAERIFADLKERMVKRIARNHGVPFRKADIVFKNDQTVAVLGSQFHIVAAEEKARRRSTAKLQGQSIRIFMPPFAEEEKARDHVSSLARRIITAAVLPEVEERVRGINAAHFNSELGRVRLKDNLSNWGSCSRDNNINLDFRLLFAPVPILDAVIAHELAHTKHRNHSKAFYATLLGAMPDYRERRRWLRLNGNLLNSDAPAAMYPITLPGGTQKSPETII